MDVEPGVEFFFRPEEIIDPSTTAAEDPRVRRLRLLDLSVLKDDVNRLTAELRMVLNCDLLVLPFRVDQRDEVDRSIGVEKSDPLHLGAVGREGDLHPALPIHVARLAHAVSNAAGVRSGLDDLKALEHAQARFNLLA